MQSFGYFQSLPIDDPESLKSLQLAVPEPRERDVLVEVRAISVNPIDVKVRRRRAAEGEVPVVLGWDAVGVVRGRGPGAQLFTEGETVWYAGALDRPGCNAALQCVDERLVARAPASLSAAEAAAMPLTSVTAWELLFDRLEVQLWPGEPVLLVLGGSGGVGSMAIQLARALTDATVVATASGEQGATWCRDLGAHHVVDHRGGDVARKVRAAGIPQVTHVISLSGSHLNFLDAVDLLAPFGRYGLIDDPEPLDVLALKRKSLSLHYELMFTRSLFSTDDMAAQGTILARVAAMVDAGRVRTTLGRHLGTVSAESLRESHRILEAGTKGPGKLVLEMPLAGR